ncbi:hypothetical protein HPULCUR_008291 [Helicostylum pulchrum]|uniref:DUF8032 domain-containing protein n=1 Tax=Helicostylum pulchrum TaxID=562976 RepID=A0ABP9Y773_9FUNG
MSGPSSQEPVIDDTNVAQSRQPSHTSDNFITPSDIDVVSSLVDQDIWSAPIGETSNHSIVHPLDSTLMLHSWDPNSFPTNLHSTDWDLALQHHHHHHHQQQQQDPSFLDSIPKNNYTVNNMMPQSPPTVHQFNNYATTNTMLPMHDFGYHDNTVFYADNVNSAPPSMANTAISTPTSGLVTPPMTNYFTSRNSLPNTTSKKTYLNHTLNTANRRSSSVETSRYGRRASSHPSVASVVSLTAHEPVSKIIDGIEYITFLYSHDRLVKEYTVRTDVDHVNLDDISMDFRTQNAIYPRANVDRSEYDGNRWNYETTCNQLGWKLCWLNKEQLFGRRGLIQRAVDSYRNRHADMRSRRVTRQEKVANGTLRKRRSKKSLTTNQL